MAMEIPVHGPFHALRARLGLGRKHRSCRAIWLLPDGPASWRQRGWPQPVKQAHDLSEQGSRDGDFGELEREVTAVASDLGVRVEHLGLGAQVGDDEADVGALRGGLDPGDDLALPSPAFGLVASLEEAAQFILSLTHAANGHVLAPRLADLRKSGVAGKAEEVAATLTFQEFHDLRRAVMTISAHGDLHPRPIGSDAANDVA